MKYILPILMSSLFLIKSAIAMEVTIAPSVRTYPTSGSVELTARHEYLLWDQRDQAKWKFGFVQPRFQLGAHGLAEAGVNFYPISILELGAGYGIVSRFYKPKPFDCDVNVCGGVVQRHRFTSRLIYGHAFSSFDLVTVLSYNRIRSSNADDSKPLVDETEVLLSSPGSDTLETSSALLGAKVEDKMYALYVKQARYLDARTKNDSQFLIYRQKISDFNVAVGAGRWASDFHDPGFSAIANISYSWGESISLF
jgi:hypothetical protein